MAGGSTYHSSFPARTRSGGILLRNTTRAHTHKKKVYLYPISHARSFAGVHRYKQSPVANKKTKKNQTLQSSLSRSPDLRTKSQEEGRALNLPKVIRAGWAAWLSVGRPGWRGFADGRTVAFSFSSSPRQRIRLATSILGRSATWPTSALLACRRLHVCPPPAPPAKRARFLLVIRPREHLFPPPLSPSQLGPRRDGEQRRGTAGQERSPGGGRERWMQISQAGHGAFAKKTQLRRTRRAAPSAFPPRRCRPLPRTSAWLPPRRPRRKRRANSSIPHRSGCIEEAPFLHFSLSGRGESA